MSEPIVLDIGTTLELPITLRDNAGVPITFTGRLWFMAKRDISDADEEAVISKEITIDNQNGVPNHGILPFVLADSEGQCAGFCDYDFKIKQSAGTDWKSSSKGTFEFRDTIRKGNPT